MLVLDPKKRYTISQIRHHKWMLRDGGAPKERPPSPILGQNARIGEYNDQILRLMHSLGVDQQKTVEVCAASFFLAHFSDVHHRSGKVPRLSCTCSDLVFFFISSAQLFTRVASRGQCTFWCSFLWKKTPIYSSHISHHQMALLLHVQHSLLIHS